MRLLPLLLLLACEEDPATTEPTLADNLGVEETEGDPDCDNLGDGHCMMPFPSDMWRKDGQLALSPAAAPRSSSRKEMSVDSMRADGFGVASPVLFQLRGATTAGLPDVFDAAPSLEAGAHTALIDAATGTLIPHWLETDWLDVAADPPVWVIRPAIALPAGARLVVGVRGLVDEAGAVVEAPAGFRALRDAEASEQIGVHARRARYEADIFPVLEAAGFPRAELQLAWDFTTRTQATATQDLATVQAKLYDALGDDGPTYVFDNIQVVNEGNVAVIADGTAQVPSFLETADSSGVRRLHRGAHGLPEANGFEAVPFRLQIPPSVLAMTTPAPVLQYGHGFLGTRDEGNNGWLRDMAQEHGFVILSADMQGMSTANAVPWVLILTQDAGRMQELSDEPMQGLANHLALQRLMRGRFQEDTTPELRRADGGPPIDPTQLWYHGNSQGGTMGNLVVTLSRDVTRGGLGVPGCCFPFLLNRSVDFDDWSGALSAVYPGAGDLSLILAILGTGWDRLEGLTWAPHLAADPLPDTPAHQALLHVGLEDAQVQNDSSWVLARSMAAVQPVDQIREVWGVPEQALPIDAPITVVNWDFGVAPDSTPLDPPVAETDTHSGPRELHEAQLQLVHFLRTGEVIDTCGGGLCVFPE
jgi:hypothetical protein